MENISKELDGLQETLQILEEKLENEDEAEEKELEIAEEKVRDKYAKKKEPIYNKINETRKEIEDFCMKIQLFSEFDSDIIGKILEQLVTTFEGEEYCYQETIYNTTKVIQCTFDKVEQKICEKVRVIVKLDYKETKYDYRFVNDNIDKLITNGKLILLDKNEERLGKNITFNYMNNRRNNIKSDVKYGRFEYVKEFMDIVIDYRINNNIIDITKEDLQRLLKKFLTDKINQIESNYQLRLEEKQKSLRKQLKSDKDNYL